MNLNFGRFLFAISCGCGKATSGRLERSHYLSTREVIAAVYNPHLKKGKTLKGRKLWTLSIDPKQREKTREEIKEMFSNLREAGWIKNGKLN